MRKGLGLGSVIVALAIAGAAVAGCSSGTAKAPTKASAEVSAVKSALSSALGNLTSAAGSETSSILAPSSTTPPSAAAALDLSGHWSGQYTGSYQGTFMLSWQQSGNSLTGTIQLSNPAQSLPLTGDLNGTTITFGTVGSLAITYTGTAAGAQCPEPIQSAVPTPVHGQAPNRLEFAAPNTEKISRRGESLAGRSPSTSRADWTRPSGAPWWRGRPAIGQELAGPRQLAAPSRGGSPRGSAPMPARLPRRRTGSSWLGS